MPRSESRPTRSVLALFAVFALIAGACSGGDDESAEEATTTTEAVEETTTTTEADEDIVASITAPSNILIGAPSAITTIKTDDDPPVAVDDAQTAGTANGQTIAIADLLLNDHAHARESYAARQLVEKRAFGPV